MEESMKKKIVISLVMVLLCSVLMALFAITASAEEGITVTYYNRQKISGAKSEVAVANADGTYTIKETAFSTGGTVTLADGTTVLNKEFYGWYDDEGIVYKPGTVVTFTKTTRLYEAYGVTVDNFADLKAAIGPGNYVKLGADILDADSGISIWERVTAVLDLNGHNLTIDNEINNGWQVHIGAFRVKRGTYCFVGEGTITHLERNKDKNGYFAMYEVHGSFDEENPQKFIVGRDVKIVTPYVLLTHAGGVKDGMPVMDLAGTIEASAILSVPYTSNAVCNIYETADITLTGDNAFVYTNTTAASETYMHLNIYGGKIKTNTSKVVIFNDFVLSSKFQIMNIQAGAFTVSAEETERMSKFIPDTLMLKGTQNEDGTTTYNVVEADCVHQWVLNESETIPPTASTTGIDRFDCALCGLEKEVITVYSPAEVDVEISVKDEEGNITKYTVKAGEIYVFEYNGFGAAAKCTIAGLKDTQEFSASQVVGIQIPAGISTFSGFANETIESITILDGATIEISVLSTLKALNKIEIKAANVKFFAITTTTLKEISSVSAGATITFDKSAFNGKSNLEILNMSSGSTYNFGENSFRQTGLKEVIFPDNSTISFTGGAAFYGCPQLSYAYFGRNCIANKSITNKPFDCAYALEVVVLMDITSISEYSFCCEGNATSGKTFREGKSGLTTPIKVYHHGESLNLNNNTFANRTSYGVEFYTNVTTIKSLSNCVYTVYSGLAHPYSEDVVRESTCVVPGAISYVTACPCGNDYRQNTYTTYSTIDTTLNNVEHEAYGTEEKLLPLSNVHVIGTVIADIIYTNYFENGTNYYYCSVCNTATLAEEAPSATPLFIAVGYSTDETNGKGVSHTIKVNRDAVELYKSIGHDFYFGVVAGIYTDGTPITGIDSTKQNIIMADMSKNSFDRIQIKISGIDDDKIETALVCCAYAIENAAEPVIKYLSGNETLDEVESIVYDAILALPPVQESKEN